MEKYTMGFDREICREKENAISGNVVHPRKSVVQVYFPHRGMSWAYYNDSFELKTGDFVYVEGKLEGYRGQVTEVNYSFKIKLSDYKKVIGVIDTDAEGEFYLTGSDVISFDRDAIPFSKVITWFRAPENCDDYVCGNDDETKFSLGDLSTMKISRNAAERGRDYYTENRVIFVEIDGTRGHAIVEGSEFYEIEFDYCYCDILNIKCSCFCGGACKHEFAAMLKLKEALELIAEKYENEYSGYFAMIEKEVFMDTVLNKEVQGKISLGF